MLASSILSAAARGGSSYVKIHQLQQVNMTCRAVIGVHGMHQAYIVVAARQRRLSRFVTLSSFQSSLSALPVPEGKQAEKHLHTTTGWEGGQQAGQMICLSPLKGIFITLDLSGCRTSSPAGVGASVAAMGASH